VKVDLLDRLDTVGEEAWQGLLARAAFPSPFMSWTWQSAWLAAFGGGRRLRLLRVGNAAGELAGLLPLAEDGDGVSRLLGGLDVSDYLDLIAPAGLEEDVWAALLQSRATAPETWDLHAIRAASPSATLLPALAPAYGLRAAAAVEDRCPILDPHLNGAIEVAWAIAEPLISIGKPLDIQITATNSGLDVDVRGSGPLSTALITRLILPAES